MLTKDRHLNHLFVYHNDRLIFKAWYAPDGRKTRSVIFDPYGPPWCPGDRDRRADGPPTRGNETP